MLYDLTFALNASDVLLTFSLLQAMEEVHRILVEVKGEGEVGRGLPAAAQGRLGPGKGAPSGTLTSGGQQLTRASTAGVWAIAPDQPWGTSARFIEVRDSQWKFNDQQIDIFTFELHSTPSAKTSAKLVSLFLTSREVGRN
jgi:hypothetical protein